MPTPKKASAPKASKATSTGVTGGATVVAGGAAGSAAGGVTTSTHGVTASEMAPSALATTDTSDFDYLGWFTVDSDGCTVRFGIEPQRYVLDAAASNYNALFSMLLACWLERHRVSLTYAIARPTALVSVEPDAPRRIVSLTTI